MTDAKRFVVEARLLGVDKNATKRGKETEYAIEVILSDESQYTMFRTLKEIVNFHTKLSSKFKVEAGYFKKEEKVIPECPIKSTIFGPQRVVRDDGSFGRLLNYYLKTIPSLPAALVKSDLVIEFFSLKASDLSAPGASKSSGEKKKRREKVEITDDSEITGPISLKSYTTIADFMDKKTKFSFKEGTTVQVLQKDSAGWWMVDAQGLIGWAPASYLIPLSEMDKQEDDKENEKLIEQDKIGTRYISISSYQASRDDELSFVKGAVVRVTKKFVDGWWLVRYNGGEGVVPGAMFRKFDKRQGTQYVKKIKRNFSSRGGTTRIVPTVKPHWMKSRYGARPTMTKTVAVSQGKPQEASKPAPPPAADTKPADSPAPDAPQKTENGSSPAPPSSDELGVVYVSQGEFEENGVAIHKNDKVKVLDSSDNDWWYVVDAKGAEGWVPAGYLEPVENNQNPRHDSASLSLGSVEDSVFDDLDDDDDDVEDGSDCMEIEDCYMVIKDYAKQDVDELDLFEGQAVCVIDDTDLDVWYVNADGQEGWVPSNILQLLIDEDIESSRESTPGALLSAGASAGASADNSEMSEDDDLSSANIKRRSHIRRKNKAELVPHPQPKPRDGMTSNSPTTNNSNSTTTGTTTTQQLHVSEGSDSDVVTTTNESSHVESVTIMVGEKTLEELEREAREAERMAREAKQKAEALKQRLELARQKKNLASN